MARLGSSVNDVPTEQARMHASLHRVAIGTYTRHDMTLPNGGTVHQFANAGGQIFAITWSGPGKPDLRSLLGGYFATFQAATPVAGSRMAHSQRRPAEVDSADLQIHTGGHMGYFWGTAYLPALVPSGFRDIDLQDKP